MKNRVLTCFAISGIAMGLTLLFWWPLYCGAGFIGGDLYYYFFPQKAFYADSLKAGAFPLWNDLAGFGYPILGESQTGAAYPFHFLSYLLLDLNTAYNFEHLFHYLICFTGTYLFSRRIGFSLTGSLFTAVVFTYGWFPPRACLEWAVLTGGWLPVALWCVESFLQTRFWRYGIGLSFVLGLQLLAGHYHLSFITLLLIVTYSVARLTLRTQPTATVSLLQQPVPRGSIAVGLLLAVVAGGGLAAVQVLPTWELKQRSTRVITGGEYDPGYGHLPPLYLTQVVMPWAWYSLNDVQEDHLLRVAAECLSPWHWFGPYRDATDLSQPYDLEQAIQRCRWGALAVGTNKVEAHLYCGLIPVALSVWWIVRRYFSKAPAGTANPLHPVFDQTTGHWILISLFAIAYATGLLMPIGKHLPGFSFFRGPGRYGIIVSFTIALFAGRCLDVLIQSMTLSAIRQLLVAMIFASTISDLWLVSRMVTYAVMVSPPRIALRQQSVIGQKLQSEGTLPRLLAPGPNAATLLGVSCVPWYLGIAPAEYVDSRNAVPALPKPLPNHQPTPAPAELIEWLSQSGVTHILNFEPLEERSWQLELVWQGVDPFLNSILARQEPMFLYRFRPDPMNRSAATFPGRARIADGNAQIELIPRQPNMPDVRRIQVTPEQSEPVELIDTELAYPGWAAVQDGKVVESRQQGMFRSAKVGAGEVTWVYRPKSVYCGIVISICTLLTLAAAGHLKFWHPKLVERLFGLGVRPHAADSVVSQKVS